ncbi:hypothetical protein PYW07_004223 [Mythimna separata]|uniref:Uncharacterized protein n=1 Tax=Mythimna separata TaxID=271217 RepID=A0AAD8DU11_MYTSE|nr:hypothetical protein PYW07_004223 [Mythimna separata]
MFCALLTSQTGWARRPCGGTAVRPLFEEWLERQHGVLTFHMTQVLTGHGKFGRFLHRIRVEETPGCHHCDDRPEDGGAYGGGMPLLGRASPCPRGGDWSQ